MRAPRAVLAVRCVMWRLAGVVLLLTAAVPARAAQPDPARYAGRVADLIQAEARRAPASPGRVLFLGSSSIRYWDLPRYFPGRRVLNHGLPGAHVSDLLHHLAPLVLEPRPDWLVVYAGDNDIADGKTPGRVLEDVGRLVRAVQAAAPATEVILLSIKPSSSRWSRWPGMREANALLDDLARSSVRVRFLDVSTPMLDAAGRPRAALLAADGLHLSPRGYALWSRLLTPLLAR